MSGDGDPTQPPPVKFPKQSNPTTIESLGEDLLLAIFLRLPSLATLIRAALTCRAWRRAVASSPSFRRRFRELHPAPLLGIFEDPDRYALPPFVASHRRDRDVLAAIRGGDFFLTALLEPSSDAAVRWRVVDCRYGYLVLMNRVARLLAIVNPFVRQRPPDYIHIPSDIHSRDGPLSLGLHLLFSDEDPMSFRVVWLLCDISRVQAVVFSSETRDWTFLSWVEIPERVPLHDSDKWWLRWGMQANGLLYWPFKNEEHMLTLDTATMEFSVFELPPHLKGQEDCFFAVGETKDGAPCIVYCIGFSIGVLNNRVGDDGVERWILVGMVYYEAESAGDDNLQVVTVEGGFAYLITTEMVLSLCIQTMKLEKLFPRTFYAHHFHPYIMAWPSSLVGNYGHFAMIQDGARNE